jgi:hypothetical protein
MRTTPHLAPYAAAIFALLGVATLMGADENVGV